MSNRKTMIRFFTIADYEEEEIWLREQHKIAYISLSVCALRT